MKTIKIASIIVFSIMALASNAQTGNGYKNQFPVKQVAYAATNIVSGQTLATGNYKQHVYKLDIQTVQETLLSCCTSHIQPSVANYKQPYSTPLNKGCVTGLVCKDNIQLDCCKL